MGKTVQGTSEVATNVGSGVTDLTTLDNTALAEMFADTMAQPAILMYENQKAISPMELINIASGENKSLSEVINKELTLQGFGAVKLDYTDTDTGEFGKYIRYILVTDQGTFTTTSSFIGRTLKMLYNVSVQSPRIMFEQKDTVVGNESRRRYMMRLLNN